MKPYSCTRCGRTLHNLHSVTMSLHACKACQLHYCVIDSTLLHFDPKTQSACGLLPPLTPKKTQGVSH